MNITLDKLYVILAAAMLAVVLGISGYLLTAGSAGDPVVTQAAPAFETAVLQEMRRTDNNVFLKAKDLTPRAPERQDVIVDAAQLGKQDLARSE